MKNKNIILNSFFKSFADIWKNKSAFLLLFILQILFFWSLFSTSVKYQTRILEDSQAISDYLSRQKLDEISIAQNVMQQKDILGEDPLLIGRHFNEIAKNFRAYLAIFFISLAAFLSFAWSWANKLTGKMKFNELNRLFTRNLVIALLYLTLMFLFFYSLFNIPIAQAADVGIFAKYVPFLIAAPIMAYFMLVSLSLPYSIRLNKILQRTLSIGIKKAHYVLSAHFINIILLAIPIILLYYFFEENLPILILSLAAIVFSFVFGKIFMVNIVEKLGNL